MIKTFNATAGGSGSGSIYLSGQTSWANAHDASTGQVVQTGVREISQEYGGGSSYRIQRGFITFDTSSLDDSANIIGATLTFTITVETNTDNDGKDYLIIVASTQASATALTTADYDCIGTTAFSNTLDISGLSGTQTLTLTAAGIAAISKTGYTMFAVREGHDFENSSITTLTTNDVTISSVVLNVELPSGGAPVFL